MGYAMFAARKIMLTDQINMTQLNLTKISNQLMDLADLGAAVSDGEISAFDIAECKNAGIAVSAGWDMATGKYKDGEYYLGLLGAEKDARQMTGGSWLANIGGAGAGAGIAALLMGTNPVGWIIALAAGAGAIIGNQLSAKTQARNQYMKQYKEQYSEKKQEEIARELQEKIANMENELQKRQQVLDTKLQAYNKELESVKQAETQGIENATPRSAGA